jgi:hypothetical protein
MLGAILSSAPKAIMRTNESEATKGTGCRRTPVCRRRRRRENAEEEAENFEEREERIEAIRGGSPLTEEEISIFHQIFTRDWAI